MWPWKRRIEVSIKRELTVLWFPPLLWPCKRLLYRLFYYVTVAVLVYGNVKRQTFGAPKTPLRTEYFSHRKTFFCHYLPNTTKRKGFAQKRTEALSKSGYFLNCIFFYVLSWIGRGWMSGFIGFVWTEGWFVTKIYMRFSNYPDRAGNVIKVLFPSGIVASLRQLASRLRVTVVPSLSLDTAVIQHSRLSAVETMAKSNLSAVLRKVDDLCLVR